MKKYIIVLLLILAFLLTSCSPRIFNRLKYLDSDAIADNTFGKLINAIKENDVAGIVSMFSQNVQNESDLQDDAQKLIDFIKGEITSYSLAREACTSSTLIKDKGKAEKTINASTTVWTDESVYYIGITKCVFNEFNANDVGIFGLSIIEASIWNRDAVYRQNKNISGITIDE